MRCFDRKGKLSELVKMVKDSEFREKLIEMIKEKSHVIKKAITIGTLIAMLGTPIIARADAPIEFESERLIDYEIGEILDIANQEGIEVEQEDWDCNIFPYYSISNGERMEEPFKIDIANDSKGNFPIKLLSLEGQEALLDKIESMPTLEEVSVLVELPEEMVEKIKGAGNYRFSYKDTEKMGLSDANDYIEKCGAIVIYNLKEETREGECPNYEGAFAKSVSLDKSISNLDADEMAFLSLESFHMCEQNNSLNTQGKVCIQIPSVSLLSTEEAMRLQDKVDFIKIESEDIKSGNEAKEVYTIGEYIEVSRGIDLIVEKVDSKSSEFEKALTIYYEIGKNTMYNSEEAEKTWRRRKEVGNLYGVFVEKSSVCAGIAEGYNAVCQRIGLESEVITSIAHAWNQVKINGKWVDIDLTGDLKYLQIGAEPMFFGANYMNSNMLNENQHLEDRAIIEQAKVKECFRRIRSKEQNRLHKENVKVSDEYEIE